MALRQTELPRHQEPTLPCPMRLWEALYFALVRHTAEPSHLHEMSLSAGLVGQRFNEAQHLRATHGAARASQEAAGGFLPCKALGLPPCAISAGLLSGASCLGEQAGGGC